MLLDKFQFRCMRTGVFEPVTLTISDLESLTISDLEFTCLVKQNIKSEAKDMTVVVGKNYFSGATPNIENAGRCTAERLSLWCIEQGKKGIKRVVPHKLSRESMVLFPSGSPAPIGAEADTWYNVSIPIFTTSFQMKPKETILNFELLKPSLVGIGVVLPSNADLFVERCPTGQFNVRNEASIYFREQERKNQKTCWASIRADKLLDGTQSGDFAKMFVFSTSKRHDSFFDCRQNGELLFLMIEHCNEFSNFSSFFSDFRARDAFCQSFCGDLLLKSAKTLRSMRNVQFCHDIESALLPPPTDAGYVETMDSVSKFLDTVQIILKGLDKEGCILKDEKKLYEEALHAVANGLANFHQSGPEINTKLDLDTEVIRIVNNFDTDTAQIMTEKFRLLEQQMNYKLEPVKPKAGMNMPHLLPVVAHSESFFHAYMSGDSKSSEELFQTIYSTALKFPELGPHCDGFHWPQEFEMPELLRNDEEPLTGLRLAFGESKNLRDCVDALSKSLVYIPVFASSLLSKFHATSLQTDAKIFLVQLIAAREIYEASKAIIQHSDESSRKYYPCSTILPVFFMTSFEVESLIIQLKTCSRTVQELENTVLKILGIRVTNKSTSIRNLLNFYEGLDVGRSNLGNLQNLATELLLQICSRIQNIYMDSISFNFPQSKEFCKFLSENSMSRFAPILARHCIHSVRAFSFLDVAGFCFASVLKECAKTSSLSEGVESKLLSDGIAIAKKSVYSESIKYRFDKFVDQDASFLTAAFSSSALDIFFSKDVGVALTFFAGILGCVYWLFGIVERMKRPFCDPAPIRYAFGQIPTACLWMSFWVAAFVAKYRSPKLVKYVFASFVALSILVGRLGQLLVFYSAYQDCPGSIQSYLHLCCLSDLSSNGQIEEKEMKAMSLSTYFMLRVLLGIGAVCMYAVAGFCCVYKQSLIVPLFAFAFAGPALIGVVYDSLLGYYGNISGFFPYAGIVFFLVMKILQRLGKRNALKVANIFFSELNDFYEEDYGKIIQNTGSLPPSFDRNFKCHAFQSHSDIDLLFRQHEFINAPFQTWIGSLLSRGPHIIEQDGAKMFGPKIPESISKMFKRNRIKGTFEKGPMKEVGRAILKIHRAYSGDVRSITDLVRCRVLLDSWDDVVEFLSLLDECCWKDKSNFNDAMNEVRSGQNPFHSDHWSARTWNEKFLLLCNFVWKHFLVNVIGWLDDTSCLSSFSASQLSQQERTLPKGAFQLVGFKNRFCESSPIGGYRDMNIKVRIGFRDSPKSNLPIFVPVENWQADVQTVVCEIQVTT